VAGATIAAVASAFRQRRVIWLHGKVGVQDTSQPIENWGFKASKIGHKMSTLSTININKLGNQ
jgi:hypothetical protein